MILCVFSPILLLQYLGLLYRAASHRTLHQKVKTYQKLLFILILDFIKLNNNFIRASDANLMRLRQTLHRFIPVIRIKCLLRAYPDFVFVIYSNELCFVLKN